MAGAECHLPACSYNAAKRTAKGKHTFALSDFELVTVYDLAPARPPVFSATKVLPRGWGSAKATHSLANGATGLEHEYALPRVRLVNEHLVCQTLQFRAA